MSAEVPIRAVFLDVGLGRRSFTDSLETIGRQEGIPVEPVDLMPFIAWGEQVATRAAYRLSPFIGGLYGWMRKKYDHKGGTTFVNVKGLKEFFDNNSRVISVSPVTSEMLSAAGIEHVQMAGDRRVHEGDVSPHVRSLIVSSVDIEGIERVRHNQYVMSFGGIVQPAGFRNVDNEAKRNKLSLKNIPHVLYSSHGAGNIPRAMRKVFQLAPPVRSEHILLSFFAGTHKIEALAIKFAAKLSGLQTENAVHPSKAKKGVIYVYQTHGPSETVRVRGRILPSMDMLILPTANELVNMAIPSIGDEEENRNSSERANWLTATRRGWLKQEQRALGQQIIELLTPVGGRSEAQRMYTRSRLYNDPEAGAMLLYYRVGQVQKDGS